MYCMRTLFHINTSTVSYITFKFTCPLYHDEITFISTATIDYITFRLSQIHCVVENMFSVDMCALCVCLPLFQIIFILTRRGPLVSATSDAAPLDLRGTYSISKLFLCRPFPRLQANSSRKQKMTTPRNDRQPMAVDIIIVFMSMGTVMLYNTVPFPQVLLESDR